ncbi:hypothetical protein E1B28_008171 [Marasmius oreades]|uniref:Uncharacterized protein n=1 Tax=Marasmius oreades TaxID=181124 RepID=A0A9P7RXZ3_9AGAR|nr:uncharacterized protein E1B28_008171 [Marasmius oreades]KAG7091769.1 hypothetical protein E1B28_008171 [Marasmius oreades]
MAGGAGEPLPSYPLPPPLLGFLELSSSFESCPPSSYFPFLSCNATWLYSYNSNSEYMPVRLSGSAGPSLDACTIVMCDLRLTYDYTPRLRYKLRKEIQLSAEDGFQKPLFIAQKKPKNCVLVSRARARAQMGRMWTRGSESGDGGGGEEIWEVGEENLEGEFRGGRSDRLFFSRIGFILRVTSTGLSTHDIPMNSILNCGLHTLPYTSQSPPSVHHIASMGVVVFF